jgi:hypothetical protein
MFFQLFIKGICFDNDSEANNILDQIGILCNWWRNSPDGTLRTPEVPRRLTERNLLWHLSKYHDPDPQANNQPFSQNTPFISVTSGAIKRARGVNVRHSAFLTALRFATKKFTQTGYLFYGYVHTIGKQSIPLESFAEEVRELHIYQMYLRYQLQGEIAAKIWIPPRCIERYEKYDGPTALTRLRSGLMPLRTAARSNPTYADPTAYSNIRGYI